MGRARAWIVLQSGRSLESSTAEFKLRPELGKELDANLQISEVILRHLLIRTE